MNQDSANSNPPSGKSPDDLLREIANARAQMNPTRVHNTGMNYYSMGIKLALEMISPVCVGAFIGYWADEWLNTRPFIMIILLFLGMGAGINGILRSFTKK